MNEREFTEAMIYLGACTNTTYTKEQIAAWYGHFAPFPREAFIKAIQRHCTVSRFPPAIAELKKQLLKLQYPVLDLSAEMEWESVCRAIQKHGRNQIPEAEKMLHPFTLKIVKMIGGLSSICLSTDQMSLRHHFIQTFKVIMERYGNVLSLPVSAMNTQEKNEKEKILEEMIDDMPSLPAFP
ncbi:MAG: hypothetical protein K6A77_10385 [Clostridiales bacterium]|nr:hypothetical protein [Clostridiales bacterium]